MQNPRLVAPSPRTCPCYRHRAVPWRSSALNSEWAGAVAVFVAAPAGHLAACGVGTVQRLMVHDIGTAVQTLIRSPHQVRRLSLAHASSHTAPHRPARCASSAGNVATRLANALCARVPLVAPQDAQLCGLNVLSALCSSSEAVSAELISDDLLSRLHLLICKSERSHAPHTLPRHATVAGDCVLPCSQLRQWSAACSAARNGKPSAARLGRACACPVGAGDPSVRQTALHCLAALCYTPANRRAIRASPGLLSSVTMLAQAPSGGGSMHMSRAGSRTFSMSLQHASPLSRQVRLSPGKGGRCDGKEGSPVRESERLRLLRWGEEGA